MGEIQVLVAAPGEVEADVLAVAVPEPAALTGAAAALDRELDGQLSDLVDSGEIRGNRDSATIVHTRAGGAKRVAVAGLGKPEELNADAVRTAAAALARRASFGGTIAWQLDDSLPIDLPDQARAVVDGVILGSYDPGQWKSNKPERREIERLVLVTDADLASQADRAQRVATWTNRARDLSNMPPNELTPERLAEIAQEISTEVSGLTVEAFGLEQARELGMGAFSAVAQGAENPAQMIVMRYEPQDAKGDVVLGLVGKAITFDTGGISIKPSEFMEEMKHDMSGGAAVVAAMGAIADLGLPVRTLAVVA